MQFRMLIGLSFMICGGMPKLVIQDEVVGEGQDYGDRNICAPYSN